MRHKAAQQQTMHRQSRTSQSKKRSTVVTFPFFLCLMKVAVLISTSSPRSVASFAFRATAVRGGRSNAALSMSTAADSGSTKGKLLVLGGTGYLGQTICQFALKEGYAPVSLSRRGIPPSDGVKLHQVDYRKGDARKQESITTVLQEGGYVGVIHAVGLLFDDKSGLGSWNKFVSGSGSLPDPDSTYDTITRLTAFNAIDAAIDYATTNKITNFPFCFTSAAEAGWPDMTGGPFIESIMPDFIKRYMVAKRAVEEKLMDSQPVLRPVIMRPSLIYSMDRPASLPAVGSFALANAVGVPFVDRPVTNEALAKAMVRSIASESILGVQRYKEIDTIGA